MSIYAQRPARGFPVAFGTPNQQNQLSTRFGGLPGSSTRWHADAMQSGAANTAQDEGTITIEVQARDEHLDDGYLRPNPLRHHERMNVGEVVFVDRAPGGAGEMFTHLMSLRVMNETLRDCTNSLSIDDYRDVDRIVDRFAPMGIYRSCTPPELKWRGIGSRSQHLSVNVEVSGRSNTTGDVWAASDKWFSPDIEERVRLIDPRIRHKLAVASGCASQLARNALVLMPVSRDFIDGKTDVIYPTLDDLYDFVRHYHGHYGVTPFVSNYLRSRGQGVGDFNGDAMHNEHVLRDGTQDPDVDAVDDDDALSLGLVRANGQRRRRVVVAAAGQTREAWEGYKPRVVYQFVPFSHMGQAPPPQSFQSSTLPGAPRAHIFHIGTTTLNESREARDPRTLDPNLLRLAVFPRVSEEEAVNAYMTAARSTIMTIAAY